MTEQEHRTREGIVVGLIGFATVALFYGAFDVLAARGTLYTVNLLGEAVFDGLRDPSVLQMPIQLNVGAIVWYSVIHLVLAIAIGSFVSYLVWMVERQPSRAGTVSLIIVAGFVITVFFVGVVSAPIRAVLPWWSIVIANGLSMVLAGWYLLRRHPGLGRLLLGGGTPQASGA